MNAVMKGVKLVEDDINDRCATRSLLNEVANQTGKDKVSIQEAADWIRNTTFTEEMTGDAVVDLMRSWGIREK